MIIGSLLYRYERSEEKIPPLREGAFTSDQEFCS